MTAWQKQDFAGAYQYICGEVRDTVPLSEFTDDLGQDQVSGFDVGKPQLNTSTTVVPVLVTFADGDTENDTFGVVVDKNNDSKICDGITR
jgi:predicted secreted protein